MPEIIGSKPPRKSGYKETVVTWINPNCQLISNRDVSVTEGIYKALRFIEERCRMQRLEGIMDGYTQRKTPPMQQHQRAENNILTR